jgi:putative SOS response-associated peptidase YedK
VLQPKDWHAWIEPTTPEVELLKPLPGGTLAVETVRRQAIEYRQRSNGTPFLPTLSG